MMEEGRESLERKMPWREERREGKEEGREEREVEGEGE